MEPGTSEKKETFFPELWQKILSLMNDHKTRRTMKLGATLYVQKSAEAVLYYCDAFNMTLGYNAKNDDGTFLHAEIEKDGDSIFAVSESKEETIRNAMLSSSLPTMSMGVNLNSNEELEHAFEVLAKGGHVLRPLGELPWSPCSADVVDKYGVCWYIYVSQHKPD
jgi:uncharacterized glyoxalase superfamily protein PhnB